MNRRQIVVFGLAAAVAGPSYASGFEDEIVASLRAQGYDQITVEVTLLGRVKITAMRQTYLREIVVNPRTGEILRDLWLSADGSVALNAPVFDDLERDDKSGSGKSGSDDDGSSNESEGGGPSGGPSGGSGNSGSGGSGSGGDRSGGSDDSGSEDKDSEDSGHKSGGGRD